MSTEFRIAELEFGKALHPRRVLARGAWLLSIGPRRDIYGDLDTYSHSFSNPLRVGIANILQYIAATGP
jgi:hypothetical protein